MTTEKTQKPANYTNEQTVELVAAYVAAVAEGEEAAKACVSEFAEKFDKSERSVVSKLAREGVYVKAEYKTKTGEKPQAKEAVADAIGKILNLAEPDVSSLAKANKKALQAVFAALANSVPVSDQV